MRTIENAHTGSTLRTQYTAGNRSLIVYTFGQVTLSRYRDVCSMTDLPSCAKRACFLVFERVKPQRHLFKCVVGDPVLFFYGTFQNVPIQLDQTQLLGKARESPVENAIGVKSMLFGTRQGIGRQ